MGRPRFAYAHGSHAAQTPDRVGDEPQAAGPPLYDMGSSQVKLLLPKFHRADSALRSQATGGVGVCASVAPPAFGCRLGWVHDIFRSRVIFLVPVLCWKAEGDASLGFAYLDGLYKKL